MSKDLALPEVGKKTHKYAQPGNYTVVITDESDASRSISKKVAVPFGLLLTVAKDPADTADRRSVTVAADNSGHGTVTITWGDGSATTTNPGDNATLSRHKYAQAGTYTISAVDSDEPARTATASVTVPFAPPPSAVVTQLAADVKKMSISLVPTAAANKGVTVDWGDSTPTTNTPGDGATAVNHKYLDNGTYTVKVSETADPASFSTRQVTVPFAGGLAMSLTAVESAPAGNPRRKITATWDNQGQGPVKVVWEAGGVEVDGTDAGTLDHTYAAAGTFTVTVTDANTPARTISANVTVPFTA